VGKQSNRQLIFYLPLAVVVTFVVAVCPVLLVWWLRASDAVTSSWVAAGVGAAASFGASYLGGAFWKTRVHSEDILFGELMLWGWVQRWRIERRLAAASDLLGLADGAPRNLPGGRLSDEQRVGLLRQLAATLEARDAYTHGHSRRVARHASNIAKRMNMSPAEVAKVRTAAAMHDVGKVKTPIAVLHKEGKLTDEEFGIIKLHPVEGASMVETLRDAELTAMVRHHHERLDGTGYPDRLAGDAIPVGARIIAVADTFDAITSTRAYRAAHAHKRALDILHAEAGTQLDPDAVRAFCRCYGGMRPLAVWTILANVPQRLVSWFGDGLGTANASSVANVMATAATTAAVGGVALGPILKPAGHSHRAIATVAASGVGSQAQNGAGPTHPAWQTRGPAHPGRRASSTSPRRPASRVASIVAPAAPRSAVIRGPVSRTISGGAAISSRRLRAHPHHSPQSLAAPQRPAAAPKPTPGHPPVGNATPVHQGVGHGAPKHHGTAVRPRGHGHGVNPGPGTGAGSQTTAGPGAGPAPGTAPGSGPAPGPAPGTGANPGPGVAPGPQIAPGQGGVSPGPGSAPGQPIAPGQDGAPGPGIAPGLGIGDVIPGLGANPAPGQVIAPGAGGGPGSSNGSGSTVAPGAGSAPRGG